MSEQISFGRRAPLAPAPRVALAPSVPPPPRVVTASEAGAEALSPEAESFRAKLALDRQPSGSGFAGWMRAQQSRRLVAWLATFALLCPGLLCFVFGAPGYVSTGLEITGIVANVWLRQTRRRHLKDITNWDAQT